MDGLRTELSGATLEGNILLGCTLACDTLALFHEPLVFPRLPDLPFNPFRGLLYTPEELLGDSSTGHERSLDGQTYHHYLEEGGAETGDIAVTLARRLHDHAIEDALHEFLEGRQVVAIMGGHAIRRDDPTYLMVARLSRDLVRAGLLPTSGGGPGAMEATHLGAWFGERDDQDLLDAVEILSAAPTHDPIDAWLGAAFEVRERYPIRSEDGSMSLGIPTWLYGHEPPSCFALRIAKYFANSVREDGLLRIATCGVVFTPGSAGTIQEVFQDAAQNHYKVTGHASPMVFLGVDYWTETKPVYPLLKALSENEDYGRWVSITDDRQEVLSQLQGFAARLQRGS